MISELDIWRSAKVLIDHHTSSAETVAKARSDAFMKQGNTDGHHLWARIAAAIRLLRQDTRLTGETVN